MASRKTFNPFYVLLMLFGTAFVITASSYVLMCLRQQRTSPYASVTLPSETQATEFDALLEENGLTMMLIELSLLAGASIAAMATDSYWERRAAENSAARHDDADRGGEAP